MKHLVRQFVLSLIFCIISSPLIAGGHKYIAYPVIFVHGFNANMESWDYTKSNLNYLFENKYGYGQGALEFEKYFPGMNYGSAKTGKFSKNGDCTIIRSYNENGYKGLKQVIENTIINSYPLNYPSEEKKVVIIAHSFGGIVTRSLLKQYPDYQDKIAKVVFVGTPHQGSPLASMLWIFTKVSPKLSELADKYNNYNIPYITSNTGTVCNIDSYSMMLNMILDYKETIDGKMADAISGQIVGPINSEALSIDAYGKAVEQLILNANVSFKKDFYVPGIIDTIEEGYSQTDTFLYQEALPSPQKYSTIYSEVKGESGDTIPICG